MLGIQRVSRGLVCAAATWACLGVQAGTQDVLTQAQALLVKGQAQ